MCFCIGGGICLAAIGGGGTSPCEVLLKLSDYPPKGDEIGGLGGGGTSSPLPGKGDA